MIRDREHVEAGPLVVAHELVRRQLAVGVRRVRVQRAPEPDAAVLERVDDPAQTAQRHRPGAFIRMFEPMHGSQHAFEHLSDVHIGPGARLGPNAFEFKGTNGFMITFDIDSKTAPPAPGSKSGM